MMEKNHGMYGTTVTAPATRGTVKPAAPLAGRVLGKYMVVYFVLSDLSLKASAAPFSKYYIVTCIDA